MKLGYVLLGIVAVLAIYKVASPKDPIRSVRRVLAPWADIAAPTRVHISNIEPGETKALHEQFVKVSAEVSGLKRDEEVQVFYSTFDGQVIAQSVSMSLQPGDLRHAAELPPGQGGLQQDIEYWIVAGDAISPRYPIHVLTTPSIVIDKIEYRLPSYTDLASYSVERQGDIAAIEGTEVVIHATANDEISSAHIDFDCDGSRDMSMEFSGRKATVKFPLVLKKSGEGGEHASYQLLFVNANGDENPQPLRYKIEVTPDRPPEITFTEPVASDEKEQSIEPGESLKLVVRAADPDFKLQDVRVMAERNGLPLVERSLLATPNAVFDGPFMLGGKGLGLKPGDTIEYWAEAVDNKLPDPNRSQTSKRRLKVVSSTGNREPGKQPRGANDPDPSADPQKNPQQNPEQGDPKQGTQQPGGRAPRAPKERPEGQNPPQEPSTEPNQGDDAAAESRQDRERSASWRRFRKSARRSATRQGGTSEKQSKQAGPRRAKARRATPGRRGAAAGGWRRSAEEIRSAEETRRWRRGSWKGHADGPRPFEGEEPPGISGTQSRSPVRRTAAKKSRPTAAGKQRQRAAGEALAQRARVGGDRRRNRRRDGWGRNGWRRDQAGRPERTE